MYQSVGGYRTRKAQPEKLGLIMLRNKRKQQLDVCIRLQYNKMPDDDGLLNTINGRVRRHNSSIFMYH